MSKYYKNFVFLSDERHKKNIKEELKDFNEILPVPNGYEKGDGLIEWCLEHWNTHPVGAMFCQEDEDNSKSNCIVFFTDYGVPFPIIQKLSEKYHLTLEIISECRDNREEPLYDVFFQNGKILKEKENTTIKHQLNEMFLKASQDDIDELDFFIEVLENGFSLEDIRVLLPEKYEYSKQFMEEHGLV